MKRGVLIILAAVSMLTCGEDTPTTTPEPARSVGPLTWNEAVSLNNRAVALMDQQEIPKATRLFEELTERAPEAPEGWVNLGIALLNSQKNAAAEKEQAFARCQACLERAMTMIPNDAHPPYSLAILEIHRGTPESRAHALELLGKAHSLAPADPSIAYRLGMAHRDAGQLTEAVRYLKRAAELAPHFSSAWYGLMQAFARLRMTPERTEAFNQYQALEDRIVPLLEKLELKYNFMGSHANVMRRLAPFGDAAPVVQPPIELVLRRSSQSLDEISAPSTGHSLPHGLVLDQGGNVRQFIEDSIVPRLAGGVAIHNIDADDFREFYIADGTTVGRLYDRRNGKITDITESCNLSADIRSIGGIFGDINHDGHPDLFVFGSGKDALFLNNGNGQFTRDKTIQTLDEVTLSATVADLDHDGDIDIATAGFLALPPTSQEASTKMTFPIDFPGASNHLFNNNRPTVFNATGGMPSFTDIAPRTIGSQTSARTVSIVALDVDRDGDLDLFLAHDGSDNQLFLNDRIWRYRLAAQSLGINDLGPALYALPLDANQDGWPDILLGRGPDAAALLLLNNGGLNFTPQTSWLGTSEEWVSRSIMTAVDLDLDGDTDLLSVDPNGDKLATLQNDGMAHFSITPQPSLSSGVRLRGTLAHDFTGDGRLDVVLTAQGGGAILMENATEPTNRGLHISLRGKRKDSMAPVWSNHFGLGAQLEIAAGPRRIYVDHRAAGSYLSGASPDIIVGIREATQADYVRVQWPDFVLQNEADLSSDKVHVYSEANRKPSSCPILFAGRPNGNGFDFVTDFLGVGGLGFFVEPGVYAEPDPTEMVRIGPLSPFDGAYRLRVAEPMEEVCYLDQLSLIAVDHPNGTVVHADERLATAPPMPTGELLCFRQRHHSTQAVATDGTDATSALARTDRTYAEGHTPDHRFVGYLAKEQAVSLTFDLPSVLASRPSPSSRLYLCINGWTEYPYSHVNFAAWQAGVRSQSISLDTESSNGEWRSAMKEFGYPAGLSRTMAVEVTSAFKATDRRWRLRTNLEVSFDEVFLAWHLGEGTISARELSFDQATLFDLGYPREHSIDGKLPRIYDPDIIDPHIDWKSMKGKLTPFGDVRTLLLKPNDTPVIFGHGAAIDLKVDAHRLTPIKPGYARTFFLKADGYCKDMDPYTAFPDTVAPLPYHSMKNYPPK